MLRKFFVLFLVLFPLAAGILSAEENPEAPEIPPAAAVAGTAEKLFYTATLNESIFVSDKEALYNARATVRVLQGKFESVVFEVLGDGDIVGVNGPQVRDWSVRRAGARVFLEIRPNTEIPVGKTFDATIVGRKALELPATLIPMMFTGTDATAFSGMVRIASTPDIRLYGKQSRGLLPIGSSLRGELAFSINGMPSLRLDIARGNELLAPVSLESFSLRGSIDGGAARFRVHAVASVREIGAEIAVLSGEAALRNFAESSDFSVRAEVSADTKLPVYYLKFPKRGDFEVDLEFDARITTEDGWNCLNFAVPAIQVAPFSLSGLKGEILFAPSSVSVPQKNGDAYEGFLPASGEFDLRWQEVSGTPPEFSACVFSADSRSEWRIITGMLRQREEMVLMISQGTLSNLVFDLYGEGEILNVSGEDLLSWRVEKNGDSRKLYVVLSRKKRGAYKLQTEARCAFSALPAKFSPLRLVPVANQPDAAVCVRFNEFLRLVNDGVLRSELCPQNGVTQVATSSFPQKGDFFASLSDASTQTVYRIANNVTGLELFVDAIRPDVSVAQTTRCYFDARRIVAVSRQNLKIRSAPLYEWRVLVPDDFSVDSVETGLLAGYEISESPQNGFRELKVVFTEPLIGEQEIRIAVSKEASISEADCTLRSLLYPDARFVRGFVGFAGAKNMRLIPSKLEGLSEVPAEFYPLRQGTLPQQVFRMRGAAWTAKVHVEKMISSLHGKISTVYCIERDRVRGEALVKCDSGAEAVDEIRLKLPDGAKFIRSTDAGLFFSPAEKDGILTAQLRTPYQGEFFLRVFFEIPVPADAQSVKSADFSGVRLLDVSGEQGEIFITSDEAVAIASPEEAAGNAAFLKVPRTNVGEGDLVAGGGSVLLSAFQYVQRPFDLTLDFAMLPEKTLSRCVITSATGRLERVDDITDALNQHLVCRFEYLNAEEASILLSLPEGTTLEKLSPIGEFNLEEKSLLSSDGSTCIVPLAVKNGRGFFEVAFSGPVLSAKNPSLVLALPKANVPVLSARLEGAGTFSGIDFENGRRNRGSWGDIFRAIGGEVSQNRTLIPAACVFAGTLIILLTTRLRFFWRFLFGAICAISLALGAMIEMSILRDGISPSYEFSSACFGAGELVSAQFTPWTSLGARFFGMNLAAGNAIWIAGALLLSIGAVWRRSAILRFAGRVGFYGAFVCGTNDIEHRIPALIAAFVVTELILLGIDCGFALKKAFSKNAAKPPASILPIVIGLLTVCGIGEPAQLRAEDGALEAELARPQEIAERITQQIQILTDRVVASGEIRVKGKAGERFDLLASPAVLTDFKKNVANAPIRLERRRGNAGIVYQIVLDRTGVFSAKFAYELALRRDARGMTLPTGNAAADVVSVSITRPDSRLGAEGEVTLAVDAGTGALQKGQIVFKPQEIRRILWNPRERDRSREPLELFSEDSNLYVPASGTIEGLHLLKLIPVQGEFDEVKIRIPEPFSVSRVEGNSIRRWNFGRDKILTVLFDSKKTEPAEISIYSQAPLELEKILTFSSPDVLDCEDGIKTIGIATGDELQVDEVVGPAPVPVDEKEFSPVLLARAAADGKAVFLRRAFRSVGADAVVRVAFSEVKPNLRITSKDTVVLNQDKVSLVMDLTAEVSRADVFSLSFSLPEGLEVESVSGDALAYWSESQDSEDLSTVTLHLKESLVGEETFRISLAGAFPIAAPTWTAPRVIFNGAQRQSGELYIHTEEGLQLRLRSRNNIVEVVPEDEESAPKTSGDGGKVPAGDDETPAADFAFRYFGSKWYANFAVGSFESRISASWTQRIESLDFGRYARVTADCTYRMENAVRQVVRIALPASALAPRFSGEDIVNAACVKNPLLAGGNAAENGTVWEIRFAKPMRGDITFRVEYFERLSRITKIDSVNALEVSDQCGQLDLAENDTFALDSESEPAAVADFTGKSVVLKMTDKTLSDWRKIRTDVREGSFSAPAVCRFSKVSRNGAVTAERIDLTVMQADLLRIGAAGNEILEVLTDGTPAKLFDAGDGNFYLLLRKKESGALTSIEILYRRSFPKGENPLIEPVRISAHPARAEWYFSENLSAGICGIARIFGLPADKASPCDEEPELPEWFPEFVVCRAFETEHYPHVDAGAEVCFPRATPPPVGPEQLDEKWAFCVLGAIVFLRILVALLLRRKKINA